MQSLDTIIADARVDWRDMLEAGTSQSKLIVYHPDGTREHLPVSGDWHPRQDEHVARELAARAGSDTFAFMFVRNSATEQPGGAMLACVGSARRWLSASGPDEAA